MEKGKRKSVLNNQFEKKKDNKEIIEAYSSESEEDEIRPKFNFLASIIHNFLPKSISDFLLLDLFELVDNGSLIVWRILWGFIMFYESLTFIEKDFQKTVLFTSNENRFPYYGFEWLQPLSPTLMNFEVVFMTLCAFFVILGFKYRIMSFLFALCFSHLFFLDQALYLNHYYLIIIISFLMPIIPANSDFSLDSIFFGTRQKKIPFWTIWILRFTIFIVYFYAGVVKINEDWLRGEPLSHWLNKRSFLPDFLKSRFTGIAFSYGGILLDLFIAPSLVFPKIRTYSIPFVLFFHLFNKLIFNIGIFPFIMLCSTTIFYEPSWPNFFSKKKPTTKLYTSPKSKILIILLFFTCFHALFPLRFFFFYGQTSTDVAWSELGHMFSWRMKLRDKNGYGKFGIVLENDNNENNEEINWIRMEDIFGIRWVRKGVCNPERLHFMAWRMKTLLENFGTKGNITKIYAKVICSLNYRPFQKMAKEDFNLLSIPLGTFEFPWLIPLLPLGTSLNHPDIFSLKEYIDFVEIDAYEFIKSRAYNEDEIDPLLWDFIIKEPKRN